MDRTHQPTRLTARSLDARQLVHGQLVSRPLFSNFVFQYPDFIEYDDLNLKILTKHDMEGCFRVWSSTDYSQLYALKLRDLYEVKLCYRYAVLLFTPIEGTIAITLARIDDGVPVKNVRI